MLLTIIKGGEREKHKINGGLCMELRAIQYDLMKERKFSDAEFFSLWGLWGDHESSGGTEEVTAAMDSSVDGHADGGNRAVSGEQDDVIIYCI